MMTRMRATQASGWAHDGAGARAFLPDFCEQGNLLRTMLIAELLAFVLVAAAPGAWSVRLQALALLSLFIQWVAIVDIALLCALQRPLARCDDRVAAVLAFALLQSVTLLFTAIAHAIAVRMGLPIGAVGLSTLLLENGVISAIVSAVVLRYFYVTAQWRRDIEATATARVQALQARIRPHFLFNSMNTIASLTRSTPAAAERAVEDLAELFRASLAERSMVSLAEEIGLVASYLRIEHDRLGERLAVEWDLVRGPEAVEIPALSLQPLVENAVYHGVQQCATGGRIRLATRCDATAVTVTITNPLPPQPDPAHGHRIAQENVRQRLALAFGAGASLTVEPDAADYRIRVRIPMPEEARS
jgi:two-component system sensor histidine kinase AlgZ